MGRLFGGFDAWSRRVGMRYFGMFTLLSKRLPRYWLLAVFWPTSGHVYIFTYLLKLSEGALCMEHDQPHRAEVVRLRRQPHSVDRAESASWYAQNLLGYFLVGHAHWQTIRILITRTKSRINLLIWSHRTHSMPTFLCFWIPRLQLSRGAFKFKAFEDR